MQYQNAINGYFKLNILKGVPKHHEEGWREGVYEGLFQINKYSFYDLSNIVIKLTKIKLLKQCSKQPNQNP